jgi:HSP20 family protein
MKLVRWDPLQEFVSMSNRLSSFGTWAPPVDIFEGQDQLVIRAEVPGVQMKDMDVRIDNGALTLRGERKQDTDIHGANAHRMERVYGAFTRSFSLPTTVDAAKVTATYRDGVLEVTVPKAETAKPKSIEIKAA